jgi:hypothetical protein
MTEFYILLVLAIIVSFIPIINIPFKTVETFAHEMSHGLSAVLTFGKMHKLHINKDGSGHCLISGGIRFITLLAGYTGASTAGIVIYYIGTVLERGQAHGFLYGILIFLIFTTLMWVRDFSTLFCMILMGALFYLPLRYELIEYTSIYLKFIGIYVALSALRSPLHLIDGKDIGDGAELFKVTFLPEGVWIVAWVLYGLYCVYNIYIIAKLGESWTILS